MRGAYHFGRPDLGNSPEAEAEWFYSVVNGSGIEPGDLLALDLEMGTGSLAWYAARFEAKLRALCGFNPMFYASPNFMATRGINFGNIGGSYGLWEADWQATMPAPAAGWPVLAIWQYGSGGTLAGINGRVDGDIFNGDRATLLKYGKPGVAADKGGSVTPPVTPPAPVYEALTDKGWPIASGPDEAAIEANAVTWQHANLTAGATITKDGQPFKTLAPIPRDPGADPDTIEDRGHAATEGSAHGGNQGYMVNDPTGPTPTPVVVPIPDVPEPPVVAEQGVTTSEWKLALGFLAQLATAGTAAGIAKLGYHVDSATLGILVQLEFIGGLAVASYVISRGVRKLGAK